MPCLQERTSPQHQRKQSFLPGLQPEISDQERDSRHDPRRRGGDLTTASRRKIFVIINPASGGWRPANLTGQIVASFRRSGLDHEIVETKKQGDATRIASLVD